MKAKEALREFFGDIAMESRPVPWEYSDYYEKELGAPLHRSFLFFRQRARPDRLPDIKLMTNEVEARLSEGGKRAINLDPGYLTAHNVVLASTKNYAHRIFLGKGIYGEVTLVFREGRYRPHLFTYRDYASEQCIELFAQARMLL